MIEWVHLKGYSVSRIREYFSDPNSSIRMVTMLVGALILMSGIYYCPYRYLSDILGFNRCMDKYGCESVGSGGMDSLHGEDRNLLESVLSRLNIPEVRVLDGKGNEFLICLEETMRDYGRITSRLKVPGDNELEGRIDELIRGSISCEALGFFERDRGYFLNGKVYFGHEGLEYVPYDPEKNCFHSIIHDPMKHLAGIGCRFYSRTNVDRMRRDIDNLIDHHWARHCRSVLGQRLRLILRDQEYNEEVSIDEMIPLIQDQLKDLMLHEPSRIYDRIFGETGNNLNQSDPLDASGVTQSKYHQVGRVIRNTIDTENEGDIVGPIEILENGNLNDTDENNPES